MEYRATRSVVDLGGSGCGHDLFAQAEFVKAEEQVAERVTAAIGNPSLRQMVGPVVQHVASLAEAAQVCQPVVGRVAVQVGGSEHDAGGAQPCCLQKVWPTGGTAAAVAPGRGFLVEPATVRQAAKLRQMRPATSLASAAGTLKAHARA